ncbi:hypothetical protein ACPOL_3947 [Acidisarcina polymorpha]|uniref:Uncharacterized protein n=1 Tax=Acidisarcina polymorpha TaxID=2211140 RepID=A0A2Z5G3Z5_9BACT|nr:hypothetical protein ACPOL_3947 [Acidisarcina polymorpha]
MVMMTAMATMMVGLSKNRCCEDQEQGESQKLFHSAKNINCRGRSPVQELAAPSKPPPSSSMTDAGEANGLSLRRK